MLWLQPKTLFTQSSLVKNLFLFSLSCSWKRLSSSLPVPYSRVPGQEKCPHLTFPPLEMSARSGITLGLLWYDGEFSSSGRKPFLSGWGWGKSEDSEAQLPSRHSDSLDSILFHSLGFLRHISTRGQIIKTQGRFGLFWKDDCRLDKVFSRTFSLVCSVLLTRSGRADVSPTSPKQKQEGKRGVLESNFSTGRES